MKRIALQRVCLAALLLLIAVAASAAPKVEDFTFLQISDIHSPRAESASTISQIASLGPIELQPYGVTALPPSFVVVTGDITEFGAGYGKAWDEYVGYWKDVKIPRYEVAGNHDNTWDSIRWRLRKLPQGGNYFSFDRFGCHFIGLDSASCQDPRPNFPEEQIAWLRADLAKVDTQTPVFVFFHHPLEGKSEWAGEYDKIRLIDVMRGHNVALIIGGHSHAAKAYKWGGFDCITGGSTYSIPDRNIYGGMAVISVQNGTLRVAYKKASETAATQPLVEKPLLPAQAYPKITFSSPKERHSYDGQVKISAWIKLPKDAVKEAKWKLDDDSEGVLEQKPGGSFEAVIDPAALSAGAHFLLARFTSSDGAVYEAGTSFYYDPKPSPVAWRAFIPASIKGQMTATDKAIYAGGGDGNLYALSPEDGKVLWTFKTGGEIISQPMVTENSIYVTSGDGKLYALDLQGKQKWSFETGGAIYSSPVLSGNLVLFGSNDTDFYAVDAVTGKQAWKFDIPEYTIESKPFVKDGVVYFGAWDQHVYALNVADGSMKWKCVGKGSASQKAGRYYSPADCGPVIAGNNVFVADRNYDLSIIDAASGTLTGGSPLCSATGLSQDGSFVYLRKKAGGEAKSMLAKLDSTGKEVWSVPATLDVIPASPTEQDGIVYACSNSGLVQMFSAPDGKLLGEYRVTPKIMVFAGIEVRNGTAYVGGMDGSVTALRFKP